MLDFIIKTFLAAICMHNITRSRIILYVIPVR